MPDFPKLMSFQVLNAINFQVALGPPLILLARAWGASPLYIGAVTALVPLLTTLQVYMAPRAEYLGFRRIMLSGWASRNLMVGLVAALPWLAIWKIATPSVLLLALFILMFFFNAIRGLATASWMPWLSVLVPDPWRGRYLSAEQFTINLTSAVIFLFCGWILGANPRDAQFSELYFMAFLSGIFSLYYLKHIDSPPPRAGLPVLEPFRVWARRVWRVRAFRRLIRLNMMFVLVIGAWNTFTIVFMRDVLKINDGAILYISGASTLGAVAGATAWGRLADRFGSRPVMDVATWFLLVVLAGWLLVALGCLPVNIYGITALFVLFGMGQLGILIPTLRFSLNNAPREFPVHALTLFSVFSSLSSAAAPLAFGFMLEALAGLHLSLGPASISNFTCFYAVEIVMLLALKWLVRELPDRRAADTRIVLYHMLTDYPLGTVNAVYNSLFNRGRNRVEKIDGELPKPQRREEEHG